MRDPTCAVPAEFVRLSHLRKLCECEQVAAVCYRLRGESIEFLLVRTRSSGRWTFPKGSAEPGLTHAQAAALEAFEEAGVHGRIEEVSFIKYVRNGRRGGARKSAARSGKKKVAVYAHLCEVFRLSPPKESKRNRTWFSAGDAKRCLREGRRSDDGAEFARVVDRAVARIRKVRSGIGVINLPQGERIQRDRLRPDTMPKDGLQKVQFEAFMETREASFLQRIRRQLHGMRQVDVPMLDDRGEVLRGEILQFDPARRKKAKALGTGTKSG
jgi:8-oxo-dGTP pyrophosphatase MutT (NUDIX family)